MNTTPFVNSTLLFYPESSPMRRWIALWYFTSLMIVWNILGHLTLGFEQSWATPITAISTALIVSMLLEAADAWATHRPIRFLGGWRAWRDFLPPCLIPGFACGMLLYSNERLWPVVFAVTVSMASKLLIRAPIAPGKTQHLFNPSNFGVGLTLLLFPQVGFAPPYHFTENVAGLWDWGLPLLILFTGVVVHGAFTGRLPLVGAWILGFGIQALVRAWLFDIPIWVPLMPMTSAAFVIFTLYMIPDPATTPLHPGRQAAFGFAVAMVYASLQLMHIVYGLFYALLAVCLFRGIGMYVMTQRRPALAPGSTSSPLQAAVASSTASKA